MCIRDRDNGGSSSGVNGGNDSGANGKIGGLYLYRYVDRWPKWLDLEELIYRPILAVALPGIFGAVFRLSLIHI